MTFPMGFHLNRVRVSWADMGEDQYREGGSMVEETGGPEMESA